MISAYSGTPLLTQANICKVRNKGKFYLDFLYQWCSFLWKIVCSFALEIVSRFVCLANWEFGFIRDRGVFGNILSGIMGRKRYLFFDIDGTLLAGSYQNPYVPESTKEALRILRDNGNFTCIATSRPQAMALELMEELGFENMVSDGGYGITVGRQLLEIRPLDKDKVVRLIHECRQKDIPWSIQVDNSNIRLCPDIRFDEVTGDRFMKPRIVDGLEPEDYPQIFKVLVACYPPVEYSLESLNGLPWCRYDKEYLFVEATDKAWGIRRIMEHFGADCSDVIVFGDAYNDMSMFSDQWTNVAMGNAVPELKARADLVTSDVDKDGIYNACVTLGLI